jgi:hypothetical protein
MRRARFMGQRQSLVASGLTGRDLQGLWKPENSCERQATCSSRPVGFAPSCDVNGISDSDAV